MFGWLRKKEFLAYVDFYIVLNGNHDVDIYGLKGISLKRVDRDTHDKHKGLKYWISSSELKRNRDTEVLKKLSAKARLDIFDLVYFKRPEKFEGIKSG